MGRQRIELNAKTRYELHQMLDELTETIEVSNTEFQNKLNQLQAEHRQRTKGIKQQIHQLRDVLRRLRYPDPWWFPPLRVVYRLLHRLQRDMELEAGEGAPNSVQNSAAACQKLTPGDGVEG